MTPAQAIGMLDRQLRQHGQDVALIRIVPDQPDLRRPGVRAFVRGYRLDELTGGIAQGDTLVVLSPTGLPAEFVAKPLDGNDSVEVDGNVCNVQAVETVRVAGRAVRLNVQVRG